MSLLNPSSIAIIGLSADSTKHGHRVLNNLRRVGFDGEIWGVHPKVPEVPGVSMFPTLADLPGVPEVVVSAVPAAVVPSIVRQSGSVGAHAVIVFAGGFAESGEAGIEIQADLANAAAESSVRVLGPNSGGIIAPSSGVAMSFLTCLDRPTEQIRSGPVGIVTQSGGTGSYVHNLAAAQGSGLAASISTGNEVDFGIADGITALADSDEVRAIGIIVEAIRDGDAFIRAVHHSHAKGKPVVAMRIGLSPQGQRLMRTHTGALATPNRVFDGVLSSLGVPVAETPEEMLEIAQILALTPSPAGPRLGVVTHSGGIAIMLSDLAEGTTLQLPTPSVALRTLLAPLLQQGSSDNPLDMGGIIGGPHRFGEIVHAFAGSGDFDAVLAVSTAHPPAHSNERVRGVLDRPHPVPVVHLWMAGDVGADALADLRHAGVPVTEEPRAAIKAMAALVDHRDHADPSLPLQPHRQLGPMNEYQAKAVAAAWGFPVVAGELVQSPEEAALAAERVGYPVVVKVSSPGLAHKTEVGGVILDNHDAVAVQNAFGLVTIGLEDSIMPIDGVLIEEQVAGPEVILGGVRDETFGPMVMVGIGGVVAEALDDVQLAPAPLARSHALRMIESLAGRKLLTKPRRGQPADLDALADLTVLLASRLAGDSSISQIDLNPVIWTQNGWLVADAVIESA